ASRRGSGPHTRPCATSHDAAGGYVSMPIRRQILPRKTRSLSCPTSQGAGVSEGTPVAAFARTRVGGSRVLANAATALDQPLGLVCLEWAGPTSPPSPLRGGGWGEGLSPVPLYFLSYLKARVPAQT